MYSIRKSENMIQFLIFREFKIQDQYPAPYSRNYKILLIIVFLPLHFFLIYESINCSVITFYSSNQ